MFKFLKKYGIPALCLGFVLAANIYVRLFPAYFPQLKTQAKNIVADRIYTKIAERVNKTFPALIPDAKIKMVSDIGLRYYKQKKDKIKSAEEAEYRRLKGPFQDENNQTYLMELDCWHYARYVENVVALGYPGDRVLGGKQWDDFMTAPSGLEMGRHNFIYYLSGFLYKIFLKVFHFNISVREFLFYLPLFFITFFIVTLYFFCKSNWGNLSAVIACLFSGLAPIFIPRSCVGWFDTDILILLFSLVIIWAYIKSISASNLLSKFFWSCFASFWLGLFAFLWIGWWFILLVIALFELNSVITLNFRKHLFSVALFLIFGFIWIIIFSGKEPFLQLFMYVKMALNLNNAFSDSVWPNVLATVSELRRANFVQIAKSCGGMILFIYSLICIVILFLLGLYKYSGTKRQTAFIVFFWFLVTLFASFSGMRFAAFMAVPLGIGFGIALQEAYYYIKENKSKLLAFLTVGVITLILSFNLIINGIEGAKGIFPLINDNWYQLLTYLKNNTDKNSIINSWWDFSDWFKPIAKRGVIIDGQTQHLPQSYWMARVLISRNEQEALSILRMLNNGGNKAFEIIDSQIKDPFKSALLLDKIIVIKSFGVANDVKNFLLKFILPEKAEEVMKQLYDKPKSAYFIVDYTMQGKVTPISYLGNWNLLKNYIIYNARHGKIDGAFLSALGLNKADVFNLFSQVKFISPKQAQGWISTGFRIYSGLLEGKNNGDTVLFKNGLVYNKKEQTLHLYSNQINDFELPKSLFIFENNKLSEFMYPNSRLNFSVLLLKSNNSYQALLLDRELMGSLFIRLYFLNGFELNNFKLFKQQDDLGAHIKVFEINWNAPLSINKDTEPKDKKVNKQKRKKAGK